MLTVRWLGLCGLAVVPLLVGGCGAAYVAGAAVALQSSGGAVDTTQVDLFIANVEASSSASIAGDAVAGGGAITAGVSQVLAKLELNDPNQEVTSVTFPVKTRGVSVSAAGASQDLTGVVTGSSLTLSANGETGQTISVNPFDPANLLDSGRKIAAAIEREVRSVVATEARNQDVYSNFTCHFDEVAGQYILRGGFSQEGEPQGFTLAVTGGDLSQALALGQGVNGSDEFSEFADISFAFVNRGDKVTGGSGVSVFLSRDKALDIEEDLHIRQFTVGADVGEMVQFGPERADSLQEFLALGRHTLPVAIPIQEFVSNKGTGRLDPFFYLIVEAAADVNPGDNRFVSPVPVQVFLAPDAAVTDPDFLISDVDAQSAVLASENASVNFSLQVVGSSLAADTPVGVTFFLSNDRLLDEPADPFNPDRDDALPQLAEDVPLAVFQVTGTVSEVTNVGTTGTVFDFTVVDQTVNVTDLVGKSLAIGAEVRNAGVREGQTIASATLQSSVTINAQQIDVFRLVVDTVFSIAVAADDEAQAVQFEVSLDFDLSVAPSGQLPFGRVGDVRSFNQSVIVPSFAPSLLPQESAATDNRTFFVLAKITSVGVSSDDPNNNTRAAINYTRVYPEASFVLLGSEKFPQPTENDPTELEAVNNQQAEGNVLAKEEQRLLQFEIPGATSQVFVSCESGEFDPNLELLSSTGTRLAFADDTPLGSGAVAFQAVAAPGDQRDFLLVVSPNDPASADVNATGSAFNVLISANPEVGLQPINLGDVFSIPSGGGTDESFLDQDTAGRTFRVTRKVVPVDLPQGSRQFLLFITEPDTLLSLRIAPEFETNVAVSLTASFEGAGLIESIVPVPTFQQGGDLLFLFDPPALNQFKLVDSGAVLITFISEGGVPVNTPSDMIIDLVYQPR